MWVTQSSPNLRETDVAGYTPKCPHIQKADEDYMHMHMHLASLYFKGLAGSKDKNVNLPNA